MRRRVVACPVCDGSGHAARTPTTTTDRCYLCRGAEVVDEQLADVWYCVNDAADHADDGVRFGVFTPEHPRWDDPAGGAPFLPLRYADACVEAVRYLLRWEQANNTSTIEILNDGSGGSMYAAAAGCGGVRVVALPVDDHTLAAIREEHT